MMKLLPETWRAKWIDPESSHDPELPHDIETKQPASYLRRRFTVKSAENACLYITCHGLYVAWINGQRVGDFVLAPGTGDYRKRLTVQRYDVSELLRQGENEIVVALGDGWYRGGVGIDGLRNYYGTDIALLCQLEAGGEIVLCSDETWEATQNGPIRENDLEIGESCDARLEEMTGWHGVAARDFGCDNLAPTESVPILEQERFPGRIVATPNGETVIDFGQNLAGYTELRVNASAGQRITLWHGETLDENGNFTQANFDPGERNKHGGIPQKIEYTCKDGLNVYKPSFCIFGFRYAKIETDIDLTGAEFTAVAVYSRMPQTGFFECGNADVNRLFKIDIPCPGDIRPGSQARYIEERDLRTQWKLEGSLDGEAWFTIEDKSRAETDLSHDLIVREEGFNARFLRLSDMAVPYGQNPCVSGLRVFGRGEGERPAVPAFTAVRAGDLDMNVTIQAQENTLGYNILFGESPEKLYHSYMVFHDGDRRVGALIKGREYYVRVDAFNECGITEGTCVKL